MEWFCTMLMSGMLISIGWRIGADVYGYLKEIVLDAPDGIRKIRRYRSRRNYRQTYITDEDRKRRLESR